MTKARFSACVYDGKPGVWDNTKGIHHATETYEAAQITASDWNAGRDQPPKTPVVPSFFFVEVTDTFGGDANYCWVDRYKVKATTMRGATAKVSKLRGYQGRLKLEGNYGDMTRHDIRGACICMFTEEWGDDYHSGLMHVQEI